VFDYTCLVRTEDWAGKTIAAYVPVDTLVPVDKPAFSFLADKAKDGWHRVKAVKLRGIFSQGLLVPFPDDWKFAPPQIGESYADYFGVKKYEEPVTAEKGDDASPPPLDVKYTEIEHLRRYQHVFAPGEAVVATEKIHGANARYTWQDGQLHVGSHKRWIAMGESIWWRIVYQMPELVEFVKSVSPMILFGEVYGKVQDLRYGLEQGFAFRAFDLYDPGQGRYLDYVDFAKRVMPHLDTAPIAYSGAFDFAAIEAAAEEDSMVAPGQLKEGVVVRPQVERWDEEVGRVCLKLHAQRYLLRKERA
jgi:RNA ligase (TIGR02306 family)